jgi:hypothetical protein
MPDRVHLSTLTPMQAGGCMTFCGGAGAGQKEFYEAQPTALSI